MKRFFKAALIMLAITLAVTSCTDKTPAELEVAIEKESYTVAPQQKLEIPFTVTNAEGTMTAFAEASDDAYELTALANGLGGGTIIFTAPDVLAETVTFDVDLTVTSGDRSANTKCTVTITASDSISVAFEETAYTFIADVDDVLELAYEVTGLGVATIENIDVSATEGWTARVGDEGKIELVVPESGNTTEVTLTVTDDYGREGTTKATVTLEDVTNITARANCHLVMPGAMFRFDVSHKGNSDREEDVLESSSVELLWQDVKGLVEEITFNPVKKTVFVNLSEQSGNAVIATRGADGEINWSWHIWVTDYNPMVNALLTQNVENAQMNWVYMNRDLGATSGDWQSMDFMGVYYQWGRKDPFPRLGDHEAATTRPIYDMEGNELSVNFVEVDNTNNQRNANQNPMTFYTNSVDAVGDWYTTTLDTHDNTLWGGSKLDNAHDKTIYDPCPAGWRIPANDYLTPGLASIEVYCGLFTQWYDYIDVDTHADDYYVAMFTIGSNTWYFPYAGRMASRDGQISLSDSSMGFANYWTANHHGSSGTTYGAYYFQLSTFMTGKANTYEKRACGHSVRCVIDTVFTDIE